MGKTNLVQIGLWVDSETKKAIKKLAEAEGRTVSNYLAQIMRAHLKESRETPGPEGKQGHR
jgi:predicted DNA-binding protein